MKQDTDKAEELKTNREQAMPECGDESAAARKMEALLKQISGNKKYLGRVFRGPSVYFAIVDGGILAIPDDGGGSPQGSPLMIIAGPTEEEKECIQHLMDTLDFDETLFSDMLDMCDEFSEDEAEDYFDENEDEDALEVYRAIKRKVKSGKTPFPSMERFFAALSMIELDSGLYYEWEGEYIDLYENICECGEAPDSFDYISTAEWVEILENLDRHFATAD